MIDLDNTLFDTVLVSPDGKRYALTDAGSDANGLFAWLTPVGADGFRTGARRRKLHYGDVDGWFIDGQDDEHESVTAGQHPASATKFANTR